MDQITKLLRKKIVVPIVAVIALALVIVLVAPLLRSDESEAEVVTVSTLEKIVNVSNISSFSSIYKGIVQVNNEKKTDQVDYYVSYSARIKAGIDLSRVTFQVDVENKTVTVVMPQVTIHEATIDMSSLDFMFYNKKANQSAVTAEAQALCQMDLDEEIKNTPAILELAGENARNILEALLKPVLAQMDADYQLIIK